MSFETFLLITTSAIAVISPLWLEIGKTPMGISVETLIKNGQLLEKM